MIEFKKFSDVVAHNICEMNKQRNLFMVDASGDELWDAYLNSFPPGTNPIYKENTEHDCRTCRQFIKQMGGVVLVKGTKLHSIWDVNASGFYAEVAKAMSAFVKSRKINSVFLHAANEVGTERTFKELEDGQVAIMNHFYARLPEGRIVTGSDRNGKLGYTNTTVEMFKRALTTLKEDAVTSVRELIAQDNLYKGSEHANTLKSFAQCLKAYHKLANDKDKNIFLWSTAMQKSIAVTRIRNSSMGKLLIDLSEGRDLEAAVSAYETMVAPVNYKRSTALVTPAMITRAEEKVESLGLLDALPRRFAVAEDVSVNNVLFADRSARTVMRDNVFTDLAKSVPDTAVKSNQKKQNKKKGEDMHIEQFLKDILPRVESMELLVENRHEPNLVSLVAPIDANAAPLFKWQNGFSWAYTGDVTDSIKQKVKKAGGKVDGYLRCSMAWFNYDDLDIHMAEPKGGYIYYGDKVSGKSKGNLDVDMNAGGGNTRSAVENICYPTLEDMPVGHYTLKVHNFNKRENQDTGFTVEVECCNEIHTFNYRQAVPDDAKIEVARLYVTKTGVKVTPLIPSETMSRDICGLPTQKFHKVNMALLSPNYWDGDEIGHKHYFFMLEGCKQAESVRGFFNEFLRDDLHEHRKVFEMLGARMKTPESEDQLSGLGFSSTVRNEVVCRVKGQINKQFNLKF